MKKIISFVVAMFMASVCFAVNPVIPLTVKQSNVRQGLADTVNCGSGVTCTASGGVWSLSASSSGGSGTWGSITGTLSSQTDLQNALNAKFTTADANADGSTLGIATFTAADFNDNGSGLISLDYTNGQKASGSQPGFLSSGDWNTFNGKQANLSLTPGTYSDGKTCTYTSSGTVLNCNTTLPTGTVTSVTCGTGLSGGTFTTSGTCAVNATQAITNISGLTSNGPVYTSGSNGTLNVGTYEGNTTTFATTTGSFTNGNIRQSDGNSNDTDSGISSNTIKYTIASTIGGGI